MVRTTLLYLARQNWLRRWMETSSVARPLTARFVAGETLGEAMSVAERLRSEQTAATLDFLGENVTSPAEASGCLQAYLQTVDAMESRHLPATVSIKLSQFGLDLSEELCRANVTALVERVRRIGSRVEIDMESSAYTERTLRIVADLNTRYTGCVRAVIQAYLGRSENDVRCLTSQGIPIRLCKGAYREPAAVAFQQKAEVDRNYLKLMRFLLESGIHPAIASHDEAMIDQCLAQVREQGIAPERFEFQMLYGIRRDLQRKLVASGYSLRLYVPYGVAWYPYFMRRLAERPANVLFLARHMFRS
jgi:proline dehydrogenase